MRPQPRAYMCGSAPRTSRNGASSITVQHRGNRSGGNSSMGRDELEPGVVDEDVGCRGPPAARVERRRGSCEVDGPARRRRALGGQRLGGRRRPGRRTHLGAGRGQPPGAGAPMPLAAPVTRAVRPARSAVPRPVTAAPPRRRLHPAGLRRCPRSPAGRSVRPVPRRAPGHRRPGPRRGHGVGGGWSTGLLRMCAAGTQHRVRPQRLGVRSSTAHGGPLRQRRCRCGRVLHPLPGRAVLRHLVRHRTAVAAVAGGVLLARTPQHAAVEVRPQLSTNTSSA